MHGRHWAPKVDVTADANELLGFYDEVAACNAFYLAMWLERGDRQFVSNHSIVHARRAYEDDPASGRTRHLLRLWLSFE